MYVYGINQTLLLKSPGPCGWLEIDKIFISIVIPSGTDEVYVDFGCDPGPCAGLMMPLPVLSGSRLFGILGWSQRQQIAPANPVRYVIDDILRPRQPTLAIYLYPGNLCIANESIQRAHGTTQCIFNLITL
jgi:hypothetical protein